MKDPADLCLHELFEEQVRRTPDVLALEDASISLTYSELNRLADRLAAYLGARASARTNPSVFTWSGGLSTWSLALPP